MAGSKLVGSPVTVVIPTYNRAGYVTQAVDSVLAQSCADFQVLVADNASEDDTRAAMSSITDPRVRYVRRPKNLGWIGNFNAALDEVDTPYVAILGDDDLLYPEMLKTTVAFMEAQPRVGMCHSPVDLIDPNGRVLRRHMRFGVWYETDTVEPGAQFIWESMLYGCRVNSSTLLLRRTSIDGLRYDPVDGEPADLGLYLRLALDWDVAYIGRALAAYRVHGNSLSSGVATPGAQGYRMSIDLITAVRDTKQRFIDAYGQRLEDPDGHQRRAAKGTCWDLVNMIRTATAPERRPSDTIRWLARAAKVEPRFLRDPGAAKLLVAALIGQRAVNWLKGSASQLSG